jgi:hypothetical protein
MHGEDHMKPHEETWETNGGYVVLAGSGACVAEAQVRGADDGNGARLIAQAPAMARLLVELMGDPDLDDYAHGRCEAVLRAAGVLP